MYTIFSSTNYLPKIVASGLALILVGFSMYIFPGGDVTIKELNAKTQKPQDLCGQMPLYYTNSFGYLPCF